MNKITSLGFISLFTVLLLAGCNLASDENNEPLSYSISGVSASVSKETAPFDYTADQLASMAQECGNEPSASYFDSLISTFSDTNKTIYNFKYTGTSQASDTFVVTLLPNKAGYASLDEFKKDFDQCAAGGNAYPKMLSGDWLLFVNSCGTGADDGSGNPIGCQEVQDVVEPTLKLNGVLSDSTESNSNEETAWETYENKDLAFRLNLPSTVTVDRVLNDEYNQMVSFAREAGVIMVKLHENDKAPSMNPEDYEYDVVNISESTLGGQKAVVVASSKGICDGPSCGGPFVVYIALNGSHSYSLTFYGDTELDDTEQKMIDSFEFTGEVAPKASEAANNLKAVEE